MGTLKRLTVGLAVGTSGLALVTGAAGTTASGARTIRLNAPIEALALGGSRVAYDLADTRGYVKGKPVGRPNRVLVWDLRTGTTTKVSKLVAMSSELNVEQLAIAGSRVAWLSNAYGNTESDDYLFTSSALKQTQHNVAKALRYGDACGAGGGGACAGPWLGGVVGSGNRILVNRWTTDTTGSITQAGLYAIEGASLKKVATGTGTVEAVAGDSTHVAVLHSDGTIGLYSANGAPLTSVTPAAKAEEIALSGRNLVVREPAGKLALYDARTGSLRKTFSLHGHLSSPALAVQGNIAVYSTGAIRALNLTSGKDRLIGRLRHPITAARLDSFGLVYANIDYRGGFDGTIVFLPLKQVAAVVS